MIAAVSTYRPSWVTSSGAPMLGPDEDVVTCAVAAVGLLGVSKAQVTRVVLVTPDPGLLDGFPASTVREALGLPHETVVAVEVGGAAATLDAILAAPAGTVVVGIDSATPAGAGAVLVGALGPAPAARVDRSLPITTRRVGDVGSRTYDDRRLAREKGWRPAISRVLEDWDGEAVLAGVATSDAERLDRKVHTPAGDVTGASATVMAVATAVENGGGRVVAVTGATAVSGDLTDVGAISVVRNEPRVLAEDDRPRLHDPPAEIPVSLPAYQRAWETKVGLLGGRCACGELSHPPRMVCLNCGREDVFTLEALPRTGSVYTIVTVRTPVPGVPGPYDIAVVQLEGTDVRVLARTCDVVPGATRIDHRGELVLRRVAVREGVPDYGYAFRPSAKEDS